MVRADIEANDTKGFTPLISASFQGHIHKVKALLEAGANIDAKDNEGKTALDWAKKQGNKKIIDILKTFDE